VRFLLALVFVVSVALVGLVVSSSSCVLAVRDPDSSVDGEAAAPDVGPSDAALDADAPEVDLDCGCCNQAVLPLLPSCSAKMAFEFPSADCKVVACKGPVAYALCTGECYTSCGCELPADFTLVDAGYLLGEAGSEPQEGATEDAHKIPEAGHDAQGGS